MADKIVGHKTVGDEHGRYRCEPLHESEANALLKRCEEEKAKRMALMPDEATARQIFYDAWLRLQECGWREAIYCPKNGSTFEVIETGSTGIHKCIYDGEWPTGSWWILSNGDMSPSWPVLFRLLPPRP